MLHTEWGGEKLHQYHQCTTTTNEMPPIYFGRAATSKDKSPRAVDTLNGPLEPVSPADFRIFVRPDIPNYFYSFISMFLGHLVAVLSFGLHSYIAALEDGAFAEAPKEQISFGRRPGFAFGLLKGQTMPESVAKRLTDDGYTTMIYQRNTIWMIDNADRARYLKVDREVLNVNPRTPVPDRYLNPQSFMSYLQLMALTTNICILMHTLCENGGITPEHIDGTEKASVVVGWRDITEDLGDNLFVFDVANVLPKLTETTNMSRSDMDRTIDGLLKRGTSLDNGTPVSFVNTITDPAQGLIMAGDVSHIDTFGKILKYHEDLAIPSVNLIGDIIGRRFLTCLGSSVEEQFASLHSLKSGLSALRLLPIGAILSHLYLCFELSIQAHAGCVPFFSFDTYEGCVMLGGPDCTFSIDGATSRMESQSNLKTEFLTCSGHGTAVNNICNVLPDTMHDKIKKCRSMVELRKICLTLNCTQDHRDKIIQFAARLNYGLNPLGVSTINLKTVFSLLSNLASINETAHPISRLALFSQDAVLVALSCFGEKTCPSWDIPGGTKVEMKSPTPPAVPLEIRTGKLATKGNTSDARWVMTTRTTDLFMAVEEFRRLSEDGSYRSVASAVAKKQGMKVFRHDQMAVFWTEMRLAMAFVNPQSRFNEDTVGAGKRKLTDSMEGPVGATVGVKKMRF